MLDFIVGVLAFAVLMMVLATLGNTTVANGFYGRLTGLTGEVLNFYPPAWAKWLIAVGFLSVLWLGPAAHSWSLFRFYGDRLNKAYMLEPDGHEPKNQSVAPRVPKSWKWGQVGMPSSTQDDQRTEWAVRTIGAIGIFVMISIFYVARFFGIPPLNLAVVAQFITEVRPLRSPAPPDW